MKMGTRSGFWMGSTYLFMEISIPSLISSWLSIPGEFGGHGNMAFMSSKKGKVIINRKENTSVSWFSGAPHFSENGGPLQSPIFIVRSLNQSHSQNMGELLSKRAT
ncbi:hypothetical protein Peur_035895 [Populus x canadensis]